MTEHIRDVRKDCDVGDILVPIVNLYSTDDDGKQVLIFRANKPYRVIGSMMPKDVQVIDETGADSLIGGEFFFEFPMASAPCLQ